MPYEWAPNNLGNLADFRAPEFHTGTGLAAIMEQKRLREQQAQQLGASIGGSVADAMQQRKKDEMYNVLMDQYSKEYGIANPFAGQGEQGYMAAKELIKMRMSAEDQSLQARMAEARISRLGRASTGGGGGGGGTVSETREATGPDIVEKDGIKFEVKRTRNGIRYERLPGQTVRGAGAGGASAVKPRTQHQQDELYLDVESLRAEAEKEKAANIAALKPGVPFSKQSALNPRAKLLGVDPVTGEPLAAPAATPPPRTAGADGTATDSKLALARQALADPNATEAEKAQARKILGQ